ncbi:hypothetical protein GB937_000874 [Aspergillus fischeri]|nr:hypothetical protein GB937_000874 [Aspergillus fischeri]
MGADGRGVGNQGESPPLNKPPRQAVVSGIGGWFKGVTGATSGINADRRGLGETDRKGGMYGAEVLDLTGILGHDEEQQQQQQQQQEGTRDDPKPNHTDNLDGA